MTAKQNLGSQAPDGSTYVTLTDGAGALGSVTLQTGDIELGAVEIKNSTTDDRVSVSAAGAMKVDASSVAVPVTDNSGSLTVDGTVAATQSGTWTVQPGNTANTTAWKVDGSAVTQPVSLASVPSHAVTNAGTFAVQSTLQAGAANTYVGNVNTEGTKATYRAAQSSIAQTASGVILVLQGSGTKTIKVTRVRFIGALTTAALITAALYRTTGDVTSVAGTATPNLTKMVTTNAAATATVKTYTSSTIGSSPSQVGALYVMGGSSTVVPQIAEFSFSDRNGQAFTISGTGEYAQLYIASGGFTGANFNVEIEWTEE